MTQINWCSVPVIVDNGTVELFEMPAPDEVADQQPAFRVTKSTSDLVTEDFARYQPSLERMASDWHEAKKRVMQDMKARTLHVAA